MCVSGKVVNGKGNPIGMATVALLHMGDSALVAGTVTDESGSFALDALVSDSALLRISYVGYATKYLAVAGKGRSGDVRLGNIKLRIETEVLDEAVVTAKARPVTMKGDTVFYNAAAIKLDAGAVLNDLIKKIPGAQIDSDGNITLNGKTITKLLVDGKEFFVKDPRAALDNLPAEAVDHVKAYDQKSDKARLTGVDDGEENPVLDIAIKEDMKKGWFGNLVAGGGTSKRYDAGGMVNRFRGDMEISALASGNNTNGSGMWDAGGGLGKWVSPGENAEQSVGANFGISKKKFSVHADVFYSHEKNYTASREARETFLPGGSSHSARTSENTQRSHRVSGNVRLRWNPDTLTTIEVYQSGSFGRSDSENAFSENTADARMERLNSSESAVNALSRNHSLSGRILVNRKLRKKGRSVMLGASYGNNVTSGEQATRSEIRFYRNDSLLRIDRGTDNGSRALNYGVRLSYYEPLWKDACLGVAYEYDSRASSSYREPTYDFSSQMGLDVVSNDMQSLYGTHTARLTLQSTRKKLHYLVGLAVVPQRSSTEIHKGVNAGKDIEQLVVNYNPSLNVVYRITDRRQLRVSYQGRSSAPSVYDLQEIKDISDPMNQQFGNPDLKTSFSNSIHLGYSTYDVEKGRSLMLNAMFGNVFNDIANKTTYDERTGIRTTQTENVNGKWNTNAYLSFSTPLKNKKFNMSVMTNAGFSNGVGYSSLAGSGNEATVSTTRTFMVGEEVRASYGNDFLDCCVSGRFDANVSRNSFDPSNNHNLFGFGGDVEVGVRFPWDMKLSTNFTCSATKGYNDGFDDMQLLWNAQLSKDFLKRKQATIRVRVYDILQNNASVNHTVGYNFTADTETNMLGCYVIVHFVYRINAMAGRKEGERRRKRGDRGRYGNASMNVSPPPLRERGRR